MKQSNRTDEQLVHDSKIHLKQSRVALGLLLEDLREIEFRMIHAKHGYPSLYEWLVKELGLCNATAYRKVQAVRLMRSVPGIAERIACGQLTLTAVSNLQKAISNEERRTKSSLLKSEKARMVLLIEGKSSSQVDRLIASEFPDFRKREETLQSVGSAHSRLTILLTEAQLLKLSRVRELTSHSNPDSRWADVIERVADDYLKRHDPAARNERPSRQKIAKHEITKRHAPRIERLHTGEEQYCFEVTSAAEVGFANGVDRGRSRRSNTVANPRTAYCAA